MTLNFGRKFIANRMSRLVESRTETKDGVISEVYPAQRLAEVKIQGSDTAIVAHYPMNWQTTPTWLKKGNSVKINFVGGNRGRKELFTHGSAIPSLISGITGETPADWLLTGGEGYATSPASMTVNISAGTVRIGGRTYTFDAGSVVLDAAPAAGYYRYDLIVVGTDGVLDYVKGTSATSDPEVPAVPANHVEVRRVLLYGGMTEVNQYNIGQVWTDPAPVSLEISLSATYMAWNIPGDHIHVTATVRDQYGQAITPAGAGMDNYDFILSWGMGNGSVDGTASPIPVSHSGITTASTVFVYTRDNLPTDESPTLEIAVNTTPSLSASATIELRDAEGDPMEGDPPGDVIGPSTSIAGNLPSFVGTDGRELQDSGISAQDVIDHLQGGGAGAVFELPIFPEYPGAVMTASGSNNDPGGDEFGMSSDYELVANTIYNYYQWLSAITSGLQSYDINAKIHIPSNFTGIPAGASVALTVGIKTQENTTSNNKIDITLRRDGSATTSALSNQKSSVAATWETVGFDETDPVLAALVAGDVLNVTIRLYSQNTKYARVGKINLQAYLGGGS